MTAEEKRTAIFESIPVRRAVCKQIIPAIASQMIALAYNIADTYFVGMLNDPIQTAAVTVVASAFLMLTALSNLFGVGGASLIAGALGQKDPERAKRISTVSFYGGFGGAILFSLLFSIFASPILYLCGASDNTFEISYGYAKWVISFGGCATILNILLANLLRAEGSAVHAFAGVTLGAVLNIILDPLFILPQFLGYGAIGAGIATALSNLIATLYFLVYLALKRKTTVIRLHPRNLKYTRRHLIRIMAIGFPSAIQYALTVAAVSLLLNFVSRYATEAVAGLGIVRKLDLLPLYFAIGVSNGLLPLLAYNHAANNHKRRHDAFKFGCLLSLSFSLLCLICYEAFAPALIALFIKDGATIAYGAVFLRIMVLAMPMMSICYPMIIQFQAMGKVRESLICSVLRKGVLDVPLLFMLNGLIPLYGCMMVQPIVDTISFIIATVFYRKINRPLHRN
ncbi:MAG: MATE family efflux transporter [Clostridiales bacterium]|jgi:putative MATE family efflux protein|nr:MATE family efflux transporter [Clostridiales bacterium]